MHVSEVDMICTRTCATHVYCDVSQISVDTKPYKVHSTLIYVELICYPKMKVGTVAVLHCAQVS